MFMNAMLGIGGSTAPPAGGAGSVVEGADTVSAAGSTIAPSIGSGAATEGLDVVSGSGTSITPLTAVAAPISESATGFAPITKTTGVTNVTASGGTPGYTYAWTWQSGGTGITITSPSTAATAFSSALNPGDDFTGTALCTVRDSLGNAAFCTVAVHIHATN